MFENHWEIGLFVMNSYHADHFCKDLNTFCSVRVIDAPEYEHCLEFLKRGYWRTSMKVGSKKSGTLLH